MVRIIILALIGFVVGGMLGGELADLGASHRGDIGRLFVGGLVGAAAGATGGGFLGRWLDRKSKEKR